MPKADLGGVRIHYQRVGRGPDVVMIHGLAANLAFWGLRITPQLAEANRVTMYDLRGHGRSDMPPRGYGARAMARDLDALLDDLDVERAHLVGHSFGGGVALEHAVIRPERVASLTLADPISPALASPLGRRAWRRGRDLRAWLTELGLPLSDDDLGDEHRLLDRLADPAGAAARRRAERESGVFVPFASWNGAARSAESWRRLVRTTSALEDLAEPGAPAPRRLREVEAPVLLVLGARSRYRGARRPAERHLRRCRTVMVPDAGHFHPALRPLEFARRVGAFVADVERGEGAGARRRGRDRRAAAGRPGASPRGATNGRAPQSRPAAARERHRTAAPDRRPA